MMSQRPPYHDLDASRSEIRLLEILDSDNPSSIIRCRQTTVSLLDRPSFAALSYVWGDPHVTENIELDGVTMAVTTSLAAALRHIPKHWDNVWKEEYPGRGPEPLRLWADAICINQQDFDERNAQVRLMGSIYPEATIVLSWLEPDGPEPLSEEGMPLFWWESKRCETLVAMKTFQLLFTAFENLSDDELLDLKWIQGYPQLCIQDGLTKTRAWKAIERFLELPYWTRAWIFQETCLAKHLTFVCSSHFLSFEKLWVVCMRLESLKSAFHQLGREKPDFLSRSAWEMLSPWGYGRWNKINRITWVQSLLRGQGGIGPAQSWYISRLGIAFRATDPKDQIYGLLALTKFKIVPDYKETTTLSDVMCQYVTALLESHVSLRTELGALEDEELKVVLRDFLKRPLEFLAYSGVGLYEKNYALPSWAPNYSAISQDNSGHSPVIDGNAFDASPAFNAIVQNPSLFVTGTRIGLVVRKEAIPPMKPNTRWSGATLAPFFADFASRSPTYVTGIPALQAIFRVAMRHRGSINSVSSSLRAIGFLRIVFYDVRKEKLVEGFERLGLGKEDAFYDSFSQVFSLGNNDLPALRLPNPTSKWTMADMDTNSDIVLQAVESLLGHSHRYHFVEIEGGYLGLAPKGAIVGDIICVLEGCPVPVVLREVDAHFVLVGTSFVEGLMDGETLELYERGEVSTQRFELR
jgi:hypothetical protein